MNETNGRPYTPPNVNLLGYSNVGMVVKAVAPTGSLINGYPEFLVAAEDSEREAAVCWRAAFQFNDERKAWEVNFYWGHYKHGVIKVDGQPYTPIQRAIADMVKNAIGTNIISNLPVEV